MLAVLRARFDVGQPGLTIIPCELREHNADILQGLLLQLAGDWKLPDAFRQWLQTECVWLETLVDRIVTAPKDHPLPSVRWKLSPRSRARSAAKRRSARKASETNSVVAAVNG